MSDGIKLELIGADELQRTLKQFPDAVAKRARRRGLRRAAARLRTLLRRDAPKGESRELRRSIGVKNLKYISSVGLQKNFYYRVLDAPSDRGAPLRPWFEQSVKRHQESAAQLIITETKKAIAFEAGKAYARSKAKR